MTGEFKSRLIDRLRRITETDPELRVGQLVSMIVELSHLEDDVLFSYEVSDADFLAACDRQFNLMAANCSQSITPKTSEVQSEILSDLERMVELRPEIPLVRLIENLAWMARPDSLTPVPDVEDDELLSACRDHLANLERRIAARNQAIASMKNYLTTEVTNR